MKVTSVFPDQSKSLFSANQALEDIGFQYFGKVHYTKQFKPVSAEVYEKDGVLYLYKEMTHCNTTIHEMFFWPCKFSKRTL